MKNFIIVSQQGSGTRLLTNLLNQHPDINIDTNEFFAQEPPPKKKQIERYLKDTKHFKIMYNHLFELNLLDQIKDRPIIHLWRESGRTFTRDMAKYGGDYTKDDLKEYILRVAKWRKKVDNACKDSYLLIYERMNIVDLLNWIGVSPIQFKEPEFKIYDHLGIDKDKYVY